MEGPAGAFVDADLPGAQGRLAFAALVVTRQPLTRDALAELVWDGHLPNQCSGAMTTTISKIRSLVTRIGLDGRATVPSLDGTYAIVLPGDGWVDLEDAHRRLDRAEGALRHSDLEVATSEATVASAILRRTLLAGIEGSWIDEQRRRQADALYRCFVVLAEAWTRRGDHQLAAVAAESAVAQDPLRELGHRLLIRAEWSRGDRGAALRALARCEELLAVELGVAPSPETQRLAAELRA